MSENEKQSHHTISSLIQQIQQQLKDLRQDNVELTEQLTNVYSDICHIRQTLIHNQSNINLNTTSLIECSTSTNRYHSKQRSDSEPNILTDRQRILTIIDDLQ